MCVVGNQFDQQFNAGTLDVSPKQWAHLVSAVMLVQDKIRTS